MGFEMTFCNPPAPPPRWNSRREFMEGLTQCEGDPFVMLLLLLNGLKTGSRKTISIELKEDFYSW